ncbi:MAG: chromate transporter [Firmicutes bacterium]|nr:chromate transporter [Bacillota bacterium]
MNTNSLLQLFFTFFKIGATTFGGGYAMLPIIKREVVERFSWLSDEEFVDALAVTQSLPGAIAVNTAIFIGYKVRGFMGAVISMLGAVLPSYIVILFIAAFLTHFTEYKLVQAAFSGIRPAIAALIAAAVLKVGRPVIKERLNLALAFLFLIFSEVLGLHAILVILSGGLIGLIRHYIHYRQTKKKCEADTE